MKPSDQLIHEAVFNEIGNHRWRRGLWDSLKDHVSDIEARYLDAVEYLNKYPNSPDAMNRVRALGTILDSVSGSYRTLELYFGKRGAK